MNDCLRGPQQFIRVGAGEAHPEEPQFPRCRLFSPATKAFLLSRGPLANLAFIAGFPSLQARRGGARGTHVLSMDLHAHVRLACELTPMASNPGATTTAMVGRIRPMPCRKVSAGTAH